MKLVKFLKNAVIYDREKMKFGNYERDCKGDKIKRKKAREKILQLIQKIPQHFTTPAS